MDTLLQKIVELETKGVDRFNPVRFRYIQSMARRATAKPGPVYAVIQSKVMAALEEYRTHFDTARKEAEQTVHRVCSAFPDAEGTIRKLFENNEFKKVGRLGRKLDRRHRQTDLSGLKDQIVRFSPAFSEKNHSVSVDELLRQQEREVLASVDNSHAGEGPGQRAGKPEITSLKRFKQTVAKLQSERLITRAINDCPENAGPHNSQMLAVTTLSTLRGISPNYLDRFVSHIGTLMWLKQAGEDADKAKSKKR